MLAGLWQKLWRRHGNQGIAALYLLALGFAAQQESRTVWLATLYGIAALALLAWVLALRRRRAINDTPTSRIASAAQGYLELRGNGAPFDSGCLYSPLHKTPCLWFRYLIEKRDHEDKWQTEDQGESNASFLLDDGSGRCVIDPEGAEFSTRHKEHWQQGDHRYTEWLLCAGDPIYALGDFRTLGGANLEQDTEADIKALLSLWKQNKVELRRRFDLNGDGEIDEQEWLLARQAAKREITRQHEEARRQPEVSVLRTPGDGRPFLLSNLSPEALARRYGLWALLHLLVFLAALSALPWVMQELPHKLP